MNQENRVTGRLILLAGRRLTKKVSGTRFSNLLEALEAYALARADANTNHWVFQRRVFPDIPQISTVVRSASGSSPSPLVRAFQAALPHNHSPTR